MWFEILKKDLMKQKAVNIILLLFITLSTIFLASSASNISLVMNGTEYYMKCANVSDLLVMIATTDEKEDFEYWLKNRDEVTEYASEELCEIKTDNVTAVKKGKQKNLDTSGNALYLGYTGGKYIKPLDADGNDLKLKAGEIALPSVLMEKNGLKPGDELQFQIADQMFTYTITEPCKDLVFGSGMAGMYRFLFCKSDYEKMVKDSAGVKVVMMGFNTRDRDNTLDAMNHHGFQTVMSTIQREAYTMFFVFDLIVAGLLVVIGICLILISLMILKFSLSFTIEDNYREIGVMKAIGMRNFSIRKIYFIKYLAIVCVGAFAGFWISIPIGNAMVDSVSKNMVLAEHANFGISLASSIVVVLFVAAMCVGFTGKLKKISAIQAIRNGENGERYHKRRGLNLYKRKHMGTVSFLGLNDILCNKKRYLVLFLTFCISFVLITVPLNTLTTMESDEMVVKFNLKPDAAVYMEKLEAEGEENYHCTEEIETAMRRIEGELAQKGYDAKLQVGVFFFPEITIKDSRNVVKHLAFYPLGSDESYFKYDEGTAPELENEIAFSKKVMENNHLNLGDSVVIEINRKPRDFIITGIYTSYMQLGESAIFNPVIDMSHEIVSNYWKVVVDMDTELTQMEMAEKLNKEFPEYKWVTAHEVVDSNVGSVKNTMQNMLQPITALLCLLIMLIVLLMMKLFIVREKGQLAMLKSIGYKNRYIQSWLVMRMVWVVILSMVVAVPLSMLSNRFILGNIFAIMGAELTIQVEPLKAYLLYPLVLLAGIMLATVFATNSVKKITTADMKIEE